MSTMGYVQMTNTLATCARCGITASIAYRDLKGYTCGPCKSVERRSLPPTRADAFNGHMVRRGMVWHPVPADGPTIKASTEDAAPTAETQPARVESPSTSTPRPVAVGVLCHCGCLLRHENETCPACLVWALKVAAIASWAAAERANRHLPTHHTRKDMAA